MTQVKQAMGFFSFVTSVHGLNESGFQSLIVFGSGQSLEDDQASYSAVLQKVATN